MQICKSNSIWGNSYLHFVKCNIGVVMSNNENLFVLIGPRHTEAYNFVIGSVSHFMTTLLADVTNKNIFALIITLKEWI